MENGRLNTALGETFELYACTVGERYPAFCAYMNGLD